MFTDVIADLKKGLLPSDFAVLKKRFNIAIIKKMAVLRLPYHFWSSDPKINPSTEQLGWVALLLEGSGGIAQVESVVAQEVAEQLTGKKSARDAGTIIQEHLQDITNKFLRFAPDEVFRQLLIDKVTHCGFAIMSKGVL